MKFSTYNAYAKLNLSLDITAKRPDGYHEVSMIMTSCSLCDIVHIKKSDTISLKILNNSDLSETDNLMIKAANAFFDYTKIVSGAEMKLEKNIPLAAGLAGGSTDAAAVIRALNDIYGTNLSYDELCKIALPIGADVPYCIKGGTYLAEGIGEKLTYIDKITDLYAVLIKPNQGLSTAEIYKKTDSEKNLIHPDNKKLIDFIKQKDYNSLAKSMKNVMEQVSINEISEIEELKNSLLNFGALGAMMSGSGPTVFGLFSSLENARLAANSLCAKYENYFVCATSIL